MFLFLAWLPLTGKTNPLPAVPPLSFLGIEQGLSNNTVRSIFQDHNGFIWLGTFDGLNRYDGYDVKTFRNKSGDTASLVHNIVLSITEDSLHHIWIGTRRGACRFDPLLQQFAAVRPLQDPSHPLNAVVKDIKTSRSNEVFIATEGSGLMRCRPGSLLAEPVQLQAFDQSITGYGVKALRTDARNNVWALVPQYGLARYDRPTNRLVLVNNTLPGAASMEFLGETLLVGNGSTLYRYNPAAQTMTLALDYQAQQPQAGSIVSFACDADNHCWIGTVLGKILVWNPGKAVLEETGNTGDPWSLHAVGLHTLYIDRQSRKWIGTARGGVAIIDPHKSRFHTISHEPGNNNSLVDNVVAAFYEAPDGKLYIGTDGAGISVWDRSTGRFTSLQNRPQDVSSLSDDAITAIKADHTQRVWITTFRQGINRYHPATGKIERFTITNPVSGKVDRVTYALLEDHNKQLWVSTLRQNSFYGALYRFNEAQNRFELFDERLSDLFTLFEDSRGNLWAGNLSQLVWIDRVNKKHRYFNMGYAVRNVFEDKAGNLWLGTEGGGLLLFDREKQVVTARYTTNEGLCSDVVLSIQQDSLSHLWMGTFNGLAEFDPVTRSFKNYYQADGLQSNQFHYNSALKLRSGEMVFGGIKGFTVFRPENIKAWQDMPPLLLTGFTVNNRPVETLPGYITQTGNGQVTAITLPYSQAVVGFRFSALEYSVPGKIKYAYYMDGWDRSWNYTGNQRTANYTHLSEGSYIFRVKCTNEEGLWNPREIAIRITVLPPWYRSWWAYALYGLCLLGALYAWVRYRMRQNRLHYEIKLAQLQAREAALNVQKEKEINEKRLTFFTNLSHEFRTPLTLIIDPVKGMMENAAEETQAGELNLVYRNARRLLNLVDQMLLVRKAETEADSLHLQLLDARELCEEVFASFVQQARLKNISYNLEAPEAAITLCGDREKLEIILFNLLANAIKFTPNGGSVRLQLEQTGEQVQITVTDTGAGIPPGTGDQLFNRFYQVKNHNGPVKTGFGIGLYLAKHFTTLHHGNIGYESTPGQGTSFRLTLLKGTDHFAGMTIHQEAPVSPPFTGEPAPAPAPADKGKELETLVTEKPTLLIVDDDEDLRTYLWQVFSKDFGILQAVNGKEGLHLAQVYLPDLIISDITMEELGGMELCRQLKETPALSHIPVILLTASTAAETRLKGIEAGADDYITKPFEKELLKARVSALLNKRNSLQQYFYNEITLQKNDGKVSVEYREFLEKCIQIVEDHLDDETFSIKTLATEMGMSRSSLYRKVNSVSGLSIVGFIRFIRLRKAAQLMVGTENNVSEIAAITGFNDMKYFRTHFSQLFGMNPSEYIRRFRKPFHNNLQLNKNMIRPD
jgi:signal transduction histidine kinase/ligand-binding sensor domain-containing protein/DNA-binding response OmpR family regulator